MKDIPEYNISGAERAEYACFAVDAYGDIIQWDHAVKEQAAGFCQIRAKLLDAPMYPGTHEMWLASLRERWESVRPKRGRPALRDGEGRDTPITWRTTAERSARLAAAAEYAQIPKSQALDEALDGWIRRHQPAKR